MTYTVIGIETFKAKTSGKEVTKIHATYENLNKIFGKGVELFFIMSENLASDLQVGDTFEPLFGRNGDKGFLAGIKLF